MTKAPRHLLCAVALGALLATPAAAQMPNINLVPELKSQTPEEKERDEKNEKAYRESLRKIPDSKATDPWGNVRGAEAAPKAAKPKPAPQKQTKASGSAN